MKTVVGFGDYMLRLNPEGYLKFIQADRFVVNYTGAEGNVCTALSYMGVPTQLVTKLPENAIADTALANLRKYGVGCDYIAHGGERMGVFYAEKGASQRPSRIVYDRKGSAFSTCLPEDFAWKDIFQNAGYFHFTGITPALGGHLPEICLDACREAKKQRLMISCDLNYRKNLWSRADAKKTMEQLLAYVDMLIANEEDAADVLDIHASDTDVTTGKLNRNGYVEVAEQISRKYGIPNVAITLRKSISASDNGWSALLYQNGKPCFSKEYMIHLVDRVGGGDSFAAGLLYAVGHDFSQQDAVEFAVAASCLKQTIELDANLSTPEDVLKLMGGDGSGRVQR